MRYFESDTCSKQEKMPSIMMPDRKAIDTKKPS